MSGNQDEEPSPSWSDITGVPRWLGALSGLGSILAGVSVSGQADQLLSDPVGFILGVVLQRLVDTALGLGEYLISLFQFVFFGSAEGDTLGVADLPIEIAMILIDAFRGPAESILGVFRDINLSLAELGQTAGIAAPIAVQALWMIELVLALALFRAALLSIDFIDIPGIDTGAAMKAFGTLTSPIRSLFNWVFSS